MAADVRRFIRKGLLFAVPFLLYGAFMVVVDPYNYFRLPSPVDDGLKGRISFKLNYAMWKMFEYRRDPSPNILLGDSRMMSLSPELVSEAASEEYYNFAYGGGSLKEAFATFDYADRLTGLENVYIGLDLNSYNGSDNKDRVSEVLAAERNPLLYLTNNNCFLAALRLTKSQLTGRPAAIGRPEGDKDAFWKKQLETTARVYYANYREPLEYRRRLADLSAVCREKGINLVFIIFPSHTDLQEKIDYYGLGEADRRLRADLEQWGLVYDFAWDNAVTRDRELFKDPYHFGETVKKSIVDTVWRGESHHVKVSGTSTVPRDPEGPIKEPLSP